MGIAAVRCDDDRRCCQGSDCCNEVEFKCPEASSVFANALPGGPVKSTSSSQWVSSRPVIQSEALKHGRESGALVKQCRTHAVASIKGYRGEGFESQVHRKDDEDTDLEQESTGDGDPFRHACADDHRCIDDDSGWHEIETPEPGGRDALIFAGPLPSVTQLSTKGPDGVPLLDGVETLSPELIHELLKTRTCRLIDMRGSDRAAGIIDGAEHVPAISSHDGFPARLPELIKRWKHDRLLVFFCQFCKHRAPFCANLFREQTNAAGNTMQRVAVMDGGFRAWQRAGLPVRNEAAGSEQARMDALAFREGLLMTTVQTSRSI